MGCQHTNPSLSVVNQSAPHRHLWTKELDSLLEQGYQAALVGRRAAISKIQRLTGWPRQACWDRARKLGLAKKRSARSRRWSCAEDQRLIGLAGTRSVRTIGQRLNRSVPAVRTRLKRLGLSSGRVRDGLTKIDLAEMLGCSRKTIRHWIHQGWLKGCYEGKRRVHDTIRVSESNLLEFWKNHPEEILFRRLNRDGIEWLLGLLSERAVVKTSESRTFQGASAICFTDDRNIPCAYG